MRKPNEMEEPERVLDDYFKDLETKAVRNLDGCSEREYMALLFHHYSSQTANAVARQVSGSFSALPCTGKVCPYSGGLSNGNGAKKSKAWEIAVKITTNPAAIAAGAVTLAVTILELIKR